MLDTTLAGRAPVASNPVALVTGAGAFRIGRVIVEQLARLGYRLAIHANHSIDQARQLAAKLSNQGVEATALQADLSDPEAASGLIDEALKRFGRLDALVNSAAIWNPVPLEEVTAEDVRRNFEINTLATFLCCRQAGLAMAQQETGGSLINIGDWAIIRPYANYAAYFPSKGAIPTLTRTLAVELAQRNPRIRVNAVLPGPVLLPADMSLEDRRATVEGTLVKREGSPLNVAHAVVFLLENDYISGVCLPVDGGRSIYSPDGGRS